MNNPKQNLPFFYKKSRYNFTPGRAGNQIKFIIIHDTGNRSSGADANAHYNYFNSRNVGASAHYFVDDNQIIQIVGDNDTSWHAGDNQGQGRHLNGATNRNSIGIELCINSNGDYNIAISNLLELVKNLQKKFNIPNERVARHYDVSRKRCPGTMAANNWALWNQFKAKLNEPKLLKMDLERNSTAQYLGQRQPTNQKPTQPTQPAKPTKPTESTKPTQPTQSTKSAQVIAREVVKGLWGNGSERITKLTQAGYNAKQIQDEVNKLINNNHRGSVQRIAREVVKGLWGNGSERVTKLTQAGYNAKQIQDEVNKLMANR